MSMQQKYRNDLHNEIVELQSRVKELEKDRDDRMNQSIYYQDKSDRLELENDHLKKIVNAAKTFYLARDAEAEKTLYNEFC